MDISGSTAITDISGTGVPVCEICQLQFIPNQPKTELLCGHFFHTECVIYEWEDHLQCPQCHTPLFTHYIRETIAIRRIERDARRERRITQIVETNNEFKKELRLLKREITNTRKAKIAFTKFGLQKKRTFQENIRDIKSLLKTKKEEAIRELKTSPEMKAWSSARARLQRKVTLFEQKYPDLTLRELMKIRSLKLPTAWNYRQLINTYSYRWRVHSWFRISD